MTLKIISLGELNVEYFDFIFSENTLVVFNGTRTMWVINPRVSQPVQCAVNEFHCSGSHFLTRTANNYALILLLINKNSSGCGPITVEQSFGIECKPGTTVTSECVEFLE